VRKRPSPKRARKSTRKTASKKAGNAAGSTAGRSGRKAAGKATPGSARKSTRKPAAKSTRKASRKAVGEDPGRKRRARRPAADPRAHRLARDCRPQEYDLRLELDPARDRAFRGEVTILLTLERARKSVELHADGITLESASIETGDATVRGRIHPRPERETAELRFPETVRSGHARLHLRFRGQLRDDLRGLYHASSGPHRYAFTQLEAADARRFFPCFDEPAMKARFRLAVTTDRAHTVLSNAPVAREEPLADGRRTVHFQPTPPLSTYLVALAVGPLEASSPARCGETEVRLWHVPGKGHLTGFSLEAACETLSRLERWFDMPYPYAKLDLVAVPDFEAGAMENAGAVFFRETLLLVDPETATLGEKKRVAEVICHELAHMWYGDLVTMAWWDDLWLNEAFATWMAFEIVDDWKPGWKMWQEFEQGRAAALGLDALSNTHPIYATVRTPEEATANFDLITYEKGAAVVRMIERYLGPEPFRRGVRAYIRRHREGNTVAADLWQALEEASGESVARVVRAWITQPGFPLLALGRRVRRGEEELVLRQQRFHAKPGERGGKRWPVPWVGRVGRAGGGVATERTLVERARAEVPLPAGTRFVYGNADEGGFFRPLHEGDALSRILEHVTELAAVERMGLVSHQWAHVRAGHAEVESLLDVAEALRDEADPDVLGALHAPLAFLVEQVAPAAASGTPERLRSWIVDIFSPAWHTLGWSADPAEPDDTRLRRAALLSLLGGLGEWEPAVAEAGRRFEAWLRDRHALEPNLADPVAVLAARSGDAARFDRMLEAARKAATPQERRRLLMALAEFRPARLVDRALALALSDEVQTQDVVLLLGRAFGNRAGRERAWAFVKRRWKAIRRRLPPMLATRLVEVTPSLQTREHRREVAAFFAANPLPTAKRALAQALERFDLNAELRGRAAPGLARWLAVRAPAEARAGRSRPQAPPRRGPASRR